MKFFIILSFFAWNALAGDIDSKINAIRAISQLKFVRSVSLVNKKFPTYHPQGVKLIGTNLYLSTVQGRSSGYGHLIQYSLDHELNPKIATPKQRITFDSGPEKKMNHSGGIDLHSGSLIVPLAHYTSKGPGQLLQVDLAQFSGYSILGTISDHVGTVVADKGLFRFMNWDAKKIYNIDSVTKMQNSVLNGTGWNYQDCKSIAENYALCSGLKGKISRTGEIHLVFFVPDTKNKIQILHAIKVDKYKGDGSLGGSRPLTNNAMDFVFLKDAKTGQISGLRFYFVPHDDKETHLLIFDS